MKFLQSAVLLALAAVVPSYAFVTPSFLSSPTTVKSSSAALSMVATNDLTGDLTVHGVPKLRKTRQVRSITTTQLNELDARVS
jgi:hypothetical protein